VIVLGAGKTAGLLEVRLMLAPSIGAAALRVAVRVAVLLLKMVKGATVKLLMVGKLRYTVTGALPYLVASSVEIAVMVTPPAAVAAGVKMPELLTVPMTVGLTDQVTVVLKLPVPVTVGMHVDVCVVRMAIGEQTAETDVIVGGTATATAAEPNLVLSSVDVAVIVAVPATEGVNTPAEVITPPDADQVTPEL
jgi:hypothetical protein